MFAEKSQKSANLMESKSQNVCTSSGSGDSQADLTELDRPVYYSFIAEINNPN